MSVNNEIPFMAIGNEELTETVKEGDVITDGKNSYPVVFNYSENRVMNLLSVKTEDGTSRLVGIPGKLFSTWSKKCANI